MNSYCNVCMHLIQLSCKIRNKQRSASLPMNLSCAQPVFVLLSFNYTYVDFGIKVICNTELILHMLNIFIFNFQFHEIQYAIILLNQKPVTHCN